MADKWLNKEGLQHYNAELKKYYSRMNHGGSLTGVYLGDYISYTGLPSCVLKIDNMIYAVDAYNAPGNMGHLYVFDYANNLRITASEKEVHCGHANSICYNRNNNRTYIAGCFDYTNTEREHSNLIYVYTPDFDYLGTISLAGRDIVTGVTFDPVKGKMYAYSDRYIHVFNEVSNTFELYYDLKPGAPFSQDIAAYNGYFFISSPQGDIDTYYLDGENTAKINSQILNGFDSNYHFRFGELEGMEFTLDGHLIAIDFVILISETQANVDYNQRDAFIIEIPVGFATPYVSSLYTSSLTSRSHSISAASVNGFSLSKIGLRCLNQLEALLYPKAGVTIDVALEEPVPVRIMRGVYIAINQNYTCFRLIAMKGNVVIVPASSAVFTVTETTYYAIQVYRDAEITFAGNNALRVAMPNASNKSNFLSVDTHSPRIFVRTSPTSENGVELKFAGVERVVAGPNKLYYGVTPIN